MSSIPYGITLFPEPSAAKIDEVIQDRIRVRWQASYWDAEIFMQNFGDLSIDILPGQSVTVIGRKSNKLIALISAFP